VLTVIKRCLHYLSQWSTDRDTVGVLPSFVQAGEVSSSLMLGEIALRASSEVLGPLVRLHVLMVMSSEMLHRVVLQILTDVSDVLTAAIIALIIRRRV
jgi:hypothetical protein